MSLAFCVLVRRLVLEPLGEDALSSGFLEGLSTLEMTSSVRSVRPAGEVGLSVLDLGLAVGDPSLSFLP